MFTVTATLFNDVTYHSRSTPCSLL